MYQVQQGVAIGTCTQIVQQVVQEYEPLIFAGKLIGACCAVSGVLLMALPIPIVVSNFAEFYKETEKKEKQLARKAEKESRLR